MKKQLNHLGPLSLIILVFLAVSTFAWAQDAPGKPDRLAEQLKKLETSLKLDSTQTAQVKRLLEASEDQAKLDRQNFKTDGLKLIDAARERRKKVFSSIALILKPEQKELLPNVRRMERMELELFMWTEGLLLTADQAFDVEGVLIGFSNVIETWIPEDLIPEGMGPGGDKGMKPRRGGKDDYGKRAKGRVSQVMKSLKDQKYNRIKKLLTKDQKALFRPIVKDLKEKDKKRRKKMKEAMK